MERERLGRGLSFIVIGCGVTLFAVSVASGQAIGATFGVLSLFTGLAFYRMSNELFDTDPVVIDPADTSVIIANLLQLGAVLLVFAGITYVFSNFGSITELFRAGPPVPTYPVFLGIFLGLILGGGVAFLTFRWERLQSANRSVPFRMIGFTATFGAYFLLLLSQPLAAIAYATVYTLSRLLVLLGMGPLSQR